ncbi:trehalose-phosphatase [Dactylosporangium fulvum]|uniref:Trehalose 6-phosphate phosphatase n=1 Tax=Dactylosporangium fulvum TaxID=53359 RepID=A0ABY5W2L7_9ACTN|nr:trehalose-phosphatase [Dactylosporangium fulvum]UWP83694.1 trehalose-phosphatase [Dactylosporangium fulvum]
MGAPDSDAILKATAERAGRCAFFFDFDGTLAPIQDDPESVYPAPGIIDTLAQVSQRLGKVVIVSARPAGFLRQRFSDLPDVAVFGLYGLEVQRAGGPVETDPSAAPFVHVMRDLADRARAELPAGTLVEYKRISVAVHYRTAPQLGPEVEQWAKERANELGLRLQSGRMVLELKPPGQRDKGSVLREETEGLSCAWYFGDDVADLRAFAALDARAEADPDFLAVRVAVANAESGQALIEAADLHVDGPEDVPALLERLLAQTP